MPCTVSRGVFHDEVIFRWMFSKKLGRIVVRLFQNNEDRPNEERLKCSLYRAKNQIFILAHCTTYHFNMKGRLKGKPITHDFTFSQLSGQFRKNIHIPRKRKTQNSEARQDNSIILQSTHQVHIQPNPISITQLKVPKSTDTDHVCILFHKFMYPVTHRFQSKTTLLWRVDSQSSEPIANSSSSPPSSAS